MYLGLLCYGYALNYHLVYLAIPRTRPLCKKKAKFVCFNYMQPQKVKLKSVQINMKHVSYITFEKIISKQSFFVSDRTTNMHFSKMQNKINGSVVTIQYHTKCTNPFYQKFTSKKFSVYIVCCNLNQVIAYVLIPT